MARMALADKTRARAATDVSCRSVPASEFCDALGSGRKVARHLVRAVRCARAANLAGELDVAAPEIGFEALQACGARAGRRTGVVETLRHRVGRLSTAAEQGDQADALHNSKRIHQGTIPSAPGLTTNDFP